MSGSLFFSYISRDHRALHSFPTRRSSDLHPAILNDRGLEPALQSLANRAPFPVTIVGVPSNREGGAVGERLEDRKSTRLNSSHVEISYAVFCLKKKNTT